MKTPSAALEVARAYHRAWNGGRFDEAGRHLADDLAIEVPINAYATKEEFLRAVERTRHMTSKLDLLAECGDEADAVLLYDMILPFGVMRVAEHFTVRDGRITRIRQIHDTAAIRTALGGT